MTVGVDLFATRAPSMSDSGKASSMPKSKNYGALRKKPGDIGLLWERVSWRSIHSTAASDRMKGTHYTFVRLT